MPPLNRALALDERHDRRRARSPSSCTSMCRGCSSRRSKYTRSSPNDDCASDRANCHRIREILGRAHDAHPLAAAAGDGLHEQRIAHDVGRLRPVRVVGRSRRRRERRRRSPARPAHRREPRSRARAVLLPIARIASALGPDERQPGVARTPRQTPGSRPEIRSRDAPRRRRCVARRRSVCRREDSSPTPGPARSRTLRRPSAREARFGRTPNTRRPWRAPSRGTSG